MADWIYVVDDDVTNVRVAGQILSKNGMRVSAFTSGQALLDAIVENKPNLILMDIMMPRMDGFETLKHLREREDCLDIPVIFLTANEEPESETKGLRMGAMDFIRKPFVPEILVARVRHTIELVRLKKELEREVREKTEANRAKTIFLSNMSHEIRTPMNAIIGLDSLALDDPTISERTRDILEKIDASARHLLGLINDILDMSRIETGRMTIRNKDFSFARTLGQVNTIVGGQCNDKGLRYDCKVNSHVDDYYVGDDMKLRQVLINLLGNAVKFTSEGGEVTLMVEEVERHEGECILQFQIKDTGIGMSKEFLPKIFEPFSQEDSTIINRYGSTGLGLSITKSIVELMNGSIMVDSEKGRGTTFIVTVTLKQSSRTEEESEDDIPKPHEMCVLVIDDDPVVCYHTQTVLESVGVSCECAASGEEAIVMVKLRHARMEPYSLILVDLEMPHMNGVETAYRIREAVAGDSPIIMLTAYTWDHIEEEARQAGVDTFISKPLFAGVILDEFREAFRRKKAEMYNKTTNLAGRRILLAEDVMVNAEMMIMVLGIREIEVDWAENGQIAVDKFKGHEAYYYDAILMDIRMPVLGGLDATKVIRTLDRPDAQKIPIIALTANAFDEDVQQSLQAGLNAHLSKPIEADVLFKTLEEFIR